MNLSSLDLNLLTAFDALMTHRNVTQAGIAIGRSQPAMSHALARLRSLLGDQLLVKSRDRMVPTARALKFHEQIRPALAGIESALTDEEEFDPDDAKRMFTVAMVEHASFVLLPQLTSHMAAEAPGIDLNIVTVANVPGVDQIDTDECEIAISLRSDDLPQHIEGKRVYEERFVAVMRTNHPVLETDFDLEDFLDHPHVAVRTSREAVGQVDLALERMGRKRRVAVGLSHVSIINMLLPKSDLIASLPERNARYFAGRQNLAVREIPFEVPSFETHMIWHRRHDDDPAHRWLRQTIERVGQNV